MKETSEVEKRKALIMGRLHETVRSLNEKRSQLKILESQHRILLYKWRSASEPEATQLIQAAKDLDTQIDNLKNDISQLERTERTLNINLNSIHQT